MEQDAGPEPALEKSAADLTVMDVYDIASLVGHEFERVIDQHGCEAIARLMPKVVRVLEILEVLVSRHHVAPELDELRLELDRLRLERMDRIEKERKHQKVGSGLSRPVRAVGARQPRARVDRARGEREARPGRVPWTIPEARGSPWGRTRVPAPLPRVVALPPRASSVASLCFVSSRVTGRQGQDPPCKDWMG